MKAKIKYCVEGNYLPEAERASAELKSNKVSQVEFIEGYRGIFGVEINGKLVFSKYKTGRFPKQGELSSLI